MYIDLFKNISKDSINPKNRIWVDVINDIQKIEEDSLVLKELEKESSNGEMNKEKEEIEKKIAILEQRIENIISIQKKETVLIEISAGMGGADAALFVADIYNMYKRFSEKMKWKTEIAESNVGSMGGFRFLSFEVSGKNVYDFFIGEYGSHRLQRIPPTESKGRIHTSTVQVVVIKEEKIKDVIIKEEELDIQTFKSSGNGGQSVNTTDSAVRIKHKPSGIVVQCQDNKSQTRNKESALRVLEIKLISIEKSKTNKSNSNIRHKQLENGGRSGRIRNYDFPEGTITDYRLNKKFYDMKNFLNGNLSELLSYKKQQKLLDIIENIKQTE